MRWWCLCMVACSSAPEPTQDTPWAWCDARASSRGNDRQQLRTGGTYCSTFQLGHTLQEQGLDKAMLHLPAARHGLEGETLPLQACIEQTPGQEGLVAAGDGTSTTVEAGDYWFTTIELPMSDPSGQDWRLTTVTRWPQGDWEVSLDGVHHAVATTGGNKAVSMVLCAEPCDGNETLFDSCTFDRVPVHQHELTWAGGSLRLDIAIGEALGTAQPGKLLSASGVLLEQSWSQEDHYNLWYAPTVHHVSRDAYIILPAPVGDIVALEVRHLDPFGDDPPTTLSLVTSSGDLQPVSIDAERFELR